MSNAFIITDDGLTVDVDNRLVTIARGAENFEMVRQAIMEGRWDDLPDLVQPAKAVTKYTQGKVRVTDDGQVFYGDSELHGVLVDYMLNMMRQGFDIAHLVTFADNLQNNTSYRVREQLFGFLQSSRLPITSDGCFLAYKKVRHDYRDCHTGTMDNSVGRLVEMPRAQVDDDPNRTCSSGLHVAAFAYAHSFQTGRMMKVKINPADVVSVPTDYNNQKMRVCRYVVVDELTQDSDDLTGSYFNSQYDSFDDDEDDDLTDMIEESQDTYDGGYEDGYEDFELGNADWSVKYPDEVSDADPAYVAGYRAGYRAAMYDA